MRLPVSVMLGLIAGLIFSATWYAMAKTMGFYSVNVYVNVNILIIALILVGVLLSVFIEKKRNKGFLEFKSALRTGMVYCLVFAILASLFNYIYYKFITPDTIDYFVADAKKYAETVAKIKAEDLPKYLDAERARFGSFKLVPSILFWGLITSLVSGVIFQKKNPYNFGEN
jgi:hypothetical protein